MKPWLTKARRFSQELPLQRDDNARFMPWIMAVMVFLLSLSLTFAFAMKSAMKEWNTSLTATITIQIPTPSLVDSKSDSADLRVKKIVEYLNSVEGIKNIMPVDPKESIDLLETWLGQGNIRRELPVPRLIDFTVADNAELDLNDLEDRIESLVPGATLDDHKMWIDELLSFGSKLLAAAYMVAAVIATAAFLMIIFATRSGLVTHHRTIELLHIMGARNTYIAKQFARNAFWLGLLGGLVGLGAASLVMLGLSQAFADVVQGLLPDWHVSMQGMVIVAILPILSGVVAMMTAWTTVLSKLSHNL